MKKFLQILFFSSTLALLGGGDPAKFNNYLKDQSAQKGLERAESNLQKALEKRRKKREAAEEEKKFIEWADKAEAQIVAEKERISREAAEEELNKEAAQWEEIHEIEAQAAAEKRALDAAEKRFRDADEQKKDREYADALEAEKLSEKIRLSKEAAQKRFDSRKRLSPEADEESLKRSHSQVLQEQPVASEGPRLTWSQALFTGHHDIEKRLIEFIKSEKVGIKGAMHIFLNERIAKAIAEQIKNQKIRVSLLVDQAKVEGKCIKILEDAGAEIFRSLKKPSLQNYYMHHKFLIFENNNSEQLLWTGSYNFSYNAKTNAENVIITNDKGLIKSFSDEFDRLMEQNKATTETQISS